MHACILAGRIPLVSRTFPQEKGENFKLTINCHVGNLDYTSHTSVIDIRRIASWERYYCIMGIL